MANTYIGKISAQDTDLTNEDITFAFKPNNKNMKDGFALLGSYKSNQSSKILHAWLITTEAIYLTEDIIFTIIAKVIGYFMVNAYSYVIRRWKVDISIWYFVYITCCRPYKPMRTNIR